jgi:uncharacterized protein
MQIGFNFTLNGTLPMVKRMLQERQIDYCELLIDNFIHMPAKELIDAFESPVAFHIMFSRYMEAESDVLRRMANRLRMYIEEMKPIYVSDHILRFTHDGRQLFHLGEIDYKQYNVIRERVECWQEMLGVRLHLENYPSIMEGGWEAPDFYRRLMQETGVGVLFDASNAVCAERNCGAPVDLWSDVVKETRHFHVAGYGPSFVAPHITIDTHDRELASDTLEFLETRRTLFDKPGATITYERDFEIEYDSISADLKRLREIFPSTEEESHEPAIACAG